MKNNRLYIIAFCLITGLSSCNKMLDLKPLDKVSDATLLATPNGIKTLVARLYAQMPMEDFNYRPTQNPAFNRRGWDGVGQNITMLDFFTDDAHRASGNGIGATNDGYWPYAQIREINLFFDNIAGAKAKGILTEAQYNILKSETHFIRAYTYFGLVKRYGGVPLITKALDNDYFPGSDNTALRIPRSTEKETWNFIMSELDLAVQFLPATPSSGDGVYRATKWAAYGLKSRAALFAASVAKYSSRVPLAGEAVNSKLVGMDASDAAAFYTQSINASKEIIDKSGKTLYMPTPANASDAAKNFQNLFVTENSEIIFCKAFLNGTTVAGQGHSYDAFYNPAQTNSGFHKFGRYSPTLDIVDAFEDYSDNGSGASVPIVTRTDGNENYSIPTRANLLSNLNLPFRRYNSLMEPFVNKDARMLASVMVPGSTWKNTPIVIQGGIISPTGALTLYAQATVKGSDGKDYFAMGAPGTAFSGFLNTTGSEDGINYTTSGFSIKKYLAEGVSVQGATESSTTSWIDFRLAEIYLNYAEAVVESGTGDEALARKVLNDLRRRAAHTDNIPATLANVLKERRVELAFEGQRYWDLIRRREFHTLFNLYKRKALVPVQDLRDAAQPKFIFVRMNQHHDEISGGRRFENHFYYNSIPGRSSNNLIQNPVYN